MRIYKSTLQLLRIPFSINLLPIFLFAVYNSYDTINWVKAILIFFIIHFIFYPASNAYNSYMDKDTGSIAGIKNPPKTTKQLYYASILLDAIGVLLSLFISIPFTLVNILLMLLSRAYSYRGIRIKKYAIVGFLMVVISQGGISYLNMYAGIQDGFNFMNLFSLDYLLQALVTTLFVGAIYPITQIYQHKEDSENGVSTISLLLGLRGTFVFSGILFILSILLLSSILEINEFATFVICMLFPIAFFLNWLRKSWNDYENVNFKNTMIMVLSAAICMNLAFVILITMRLL